MPFTDTIRKSLKKLSLLSMQRALLVVLLLPPLQAGWPTSTDDLKRAWHIVSCISSPAYPC